MSSQLKEMDFLGQTLEINAGALHMSMRAQAMTLR